MNTSVIIVLTLLVVLYFATQYAQLRSKYNPLYAWYAALTAANPNVIPSIGPTRIALGYERPWLANLLLTRPITEEMAEFMLRLVQQEKINPTYLISGPGAFVTNLAPVAALNGFVATETTWKSPNNPLGPGPPGSTDGYGAIPYNSKLALGYRCQLGQAVCGGADDIQGDLSLLTLWMHGYEEYVRQRFTSGASSVMQEWNYMFASDEVTKIDTGDACSAMSFIGDGISAGIGAAGVGAMLGAPEGGIGAIPGAVIGFVVGVGSSLFGKAKCLGA